MLSKFFRKSPLTGPMPTLFHITHAKAGSSWIYRMFADLLKEGTAPRFGSDLSKFKYQPGMVYAAAFLRRDVFLGFPELRDAKRFVVIRDLRDTLCSLYFSLKLSHPIAGNERRAAQREKLQQCSEEEGMIYLIETHLDGAAAVQQSWMGNDEIVLRYEDLIFDDGSILCDVLLKRLELPIREDALRKAIEATSFAKRYGRKLGDEDPTSHGRKGTPGDWRERFTPAIKDAFKAKYGDVMIATGYEKDAGW